MNSLASVIAGDYLMNLSHLGIQQQVWDQFQDYELFDNTERAKIRQ